MYDFSVNLFLIVMGLFLAIIFLGVGVCIGKNWSKPNKNNSEDDRENIRTE